MLKPQTTPDLLAVSLRAEIMAGTIPPGAPLRQEAIAARFAVSRLPVREALRRLESEGLVVVFPNRGAFVVRLSPAELREIIDLRILVEGDLIHHAVARLTGPDLDRIAEAEASAARAAATPDWIATDRAFHQALYLPAARPRALALVLSLRAEMERYEALYRHLPAERETWLRDHAALLAACRAADAGAARALLADHIARAGEFLIACVRDEA